MQSTTSSVRRFKKGNALRMTKFFPAPGSGVNRKASGMGITKKIMQLQANRGGRKKEALGAAGAQAVFGLPPIHLHHVVLSPTGKDEFKFAASGAGVASSLTKPLTLSDPGLGRGGDMVCSDGDEGAACLLWSLPDGYGTPLPTGPDGFRGSALLNDVRGGPMKVTPAAVQASAKLARSERKP